MNVTRYKFPLDNVLDDAASRYAKENPSIHHDPMLYWYAWPQSWSSTACGFGGIGGAMVTIAQTVVVGVADIFYVYHNGRFAYALNKDDPLMENISVRHSNITLPGRLAYEQSR